MANSGYLPANGWAHAFKPFVWLGDEDRGLAWFCESDRGWYPADPNRAITIDRRKNETVLRCHLIDRPMPVKGPLEYTFGLQATPVKNPEKTVWDYRITHHGAYGLESQPATLGREGAIVYPAAGHLRAEEGTFECWYRPALDAELAVPLEKRKHRDNRDIFTVKWADDMGRGTDCGLYWNYRGPRACRLVAQGRQGPYEPSGVVRLEGRPVAPPGDDLGREGPYLRGRQTALADRRMPPPGSCPHRLRRP